MGTGYTRNDTGNNIADGNVINASDLDGEFDAVEAAFNNSTGHTHDGTSAEGAPIEVAGPAQDLVITATEVRPKTDNTLDLGTNTLEFKDLYLDGTANIDSLVADTADINAGTIDGATLGTNSAITEAQVDNININGNAITSTDTNGNIALTPDGTGEVDISKVDIDGGTIDDTTIGGSTPAAGSFTTGQFDTSLNVDGTVTADGLTVDGDAVISDSVPALTFLESDTTDLNTGLIHQTGFFRIDTRDDSQAFLATRIKIDHATGDISFNEDTGTTPKLFWDASAEYLGIGTTSPSVVLDVVGGNSSASRAAFTRTDTSSTLEAGAYFTAGPYVGSATNDPLQIITNDIERMRIDSSGNVGIGTTNPVNRLHVEKSGSTIATFRTSNSNSNGGIELVGKNSGGTATQFFLQAGTSSELLFFQGSGVTERMRIDSSGNLFVACTSNPVSSSSVEGLYYQAGDYLAVANSGDPAAYFNRQTSDGQIVVFRKDGATVGSIGTDGGRAFITGTNGSNGCGLRFTTADIRPTNLSGSDTDDFVDLGDSGTRFDDIYATNGTIQTSDRNEKQDIEELSEAEQRVAVAAKGLLRKFRWIKRVEEKGDDARIHFGIIAQDLQAVFEAEGLDAGRYAMFIHSTWTDEETGEERSRMGVRYSELLAFIIAAI